MSNKKKWKKKKINLESYVSVETKQKPRLSKSWKIALTGLFLIAIPSFLLFVIMGKDGWIIPAAKEWGRWTIMLPVALGVATIQILVVALLLKFKKLPIEALNFLVAISLAINSFLVSSAASEWYMRVLPAIGLAFVAIPIIAINTKLKQRRQKKNEIVIKEEERKNKSLLD
ncbi:Uncharacterised protein [Metamycoplasma cloacale]|uniref:Uncharacterized protein n=1 Tax=Metamycoplasma cloacale TaxID=92401 RepID=A0A2Z4LLJ2_9BACT|nr:hypothetical protein [Metamycoplasma cloacale]AWX42550.1 hypothetical protein DK849_00405 [Metamycoplasma cloacale]VEU79770.1 Uncharacterised protein [Metamycoplasma cloacale]